MSLPFKMYENIIEEKHSLQGKMINLCADNIHTDFHGAEKAGKNNVQC
jgi:hypothetical protein